MASDRIKSRASFKSEVWAEERESVGLSGVGASWSRLLNMDPACSDLESGGVSDA